MHRDPDQFYDSVLMISLLKSKTRKFLQTHRNGIELMLAWMDSVPADRTANEYRHELAQQDAELEAHRAEALVRINRDRASKGLGPIVFQDLNGHEGLE